MTGARFGARPPVECAPDGAPCPACPERAPRIYGGVPRVPRACPKGVPSVPGPPLYRAGTGHADRHAHRNPEKFRPTTCPHCGSAILAGQAATGLWTNLEPWPLDDHGEAAALADGGHTFDLAKDMTASHRWVWSIWHADRLTFPRVRHAEHRCGVTYARPPEQTFELIAEVATAPDDTPPF